MKKLCVFFQILCSSYDNIYIENEKKMLQKAGYHMI